MNKLSNNVTMTPVPSFWVPDFVRYTKTKQDPTKDEAKKMKEMKHGN